MLTKAADIPPSEEISNLLVNWQKLTLNQKGYSLPFIKIPFQQKLPSVTRMNQEQIALVDLELKEMLKKGAIKRIQPIQGVFMTNLFLEGKKTKVIAL